MDQHIPDIAQETIPDDPGFAPRIQDLRALCANGASRAACEKLIALHTDADRFIEALKQGLFRAPLAWTDEQKAAARWISLQHHHLARIAGRVVAALTLDAGADPDHMAQATALGLHHMAEAMKCEMAEAAREPRHFATLHGLLRPALAQGWHHRYVTLQVQGRATPCTVESLYFRALLLARSGGVLTSQQVEILDAWIWMWMPELQGVSQPPQGPALRADLDSNHGLRRRPRTGEGPVRYLPLLPLERGYRAIVAQFQNGDIAPAEGHASRFRLEEHMVVLDMARRALRGIRREPVSRAPRMASSVMSELHVGLAEIMSRAFVAAAPSSVIAELVGHDANPALAPRRERDNPVAGIYDIARRKVRVVDVSASGLGLEGALTDCGQIAVGDVVALRLSPNGPVELGKVARRASAGDDSKILIGVLRAAGAAEPQVLVGVRQLSASVQRLAVTYSPGKPGARTEQMVYVPGEDPSGRGDAFLVAESAISDRREFEAQVGELTFSLGLNRVRDRGRGWILAGFEILAMSKRKRAEPAAVRAAPALVARGA